MNSQEKLRLYGKRNDNWHSVGVDGFYEHERRTHVINTNSREVKGYAKIVSELEIVHVRGNDFGIDGLADGKKEFDKIAKIPINRASYNKLMFKRRYVR